MDAVVAELARRHPSVAFLRVRAAAAARVAAFSAPLVSEPPLNQTPDIQQQNPTYVYTQQVEAEKLDALAERYGVEAVPLCLPLRNGAPVNGAAVDGADAAALAQRVAELAAGGGATTASAAAGAAPAAAPAQQPQPQQQPQPIEARIKTLLASAPLLLFMKGSRAQPYCGFSARVVEALDATGHDYSTFDIFSDEAVRQGLKAYSNWPTYPQLYLNGELVGGCDIVTEMAAGGELQGLLDGALGAPGGKGGGGAAAAAAAAPAAAAPAAAAPQQQQQPAANGALTPELRARLEALVRERPVMLFMKGSPAAPRCGFSRKVVEALEGAGLGGFGAFDILSDEAVRQGLKALSDWPTYPQLYVNGELVGGCDIVLEMAAAGELKGAVEEMLHRTTA